MTLEIVAGTDQEQLTRREREIVALLMQGETSTDMLAERLFVSPHTLHFHMGSILRKFGVSNRAQAVAFAWQHGILVKDQWYPTCEDSAR